MDTLGGGWTRFGKGNMSSVWNYQDEDAAETTIDVIPKSDISKMQNMHFTEFKILTDVDFWLQADDSRNPSSLIFLDLTLDSQDLMQIDGIADHTHLIFDSEGKVIKMTSQCYGISHPLMTKR